jgi:hypothetical protein
VFDAGPWREPPPPLGYIVAVDRDDAPTLRFVRAGTELVERLGRHLEGALIEAGDKDLLGDIPRALRRRLDGSPGYDYARFALGDGEISTVERLLLPLVDETGCVRHIFGLVAVNGRASPGLPG